MYCRPQWSNFTGSLVSSSASQGMQSVWQADELPRFVRGEKQYMFDHKGQRYLDTANSSQLGEASRVYT